ncbi:SU10 major capsid protein [Streptomyces avermitilis]|uniref:SU10 major capsid protein n=1 Tax=Streptomyces avermitilis TaxID=33903 RepID=UPI0033CB7518
MDAIDANTFKVSTSSGGSAITLGTASGLAYTVPWSTTLTGDHVSDLLQLAYDNSGISEQETATLLVNSRQKRAITAAYANAYGKFQETSRNVGGVAVNTIVTDFVTLNVMLDRHMPQDTIAAVSMEQLMPVFLNIPSKGVMFEEPLAKTGASDEVQIYGEVGLKYGNEKAHAVMTGLPV